MSKGTQTAMRRMANSKKLYQIPGHGKKLLDVERMKLFSQTQSWPYISDQWVFVFVFNINYFITMATNTAIGRNRSRLTGSY